MNEQAHSASGAEFSFEVDLRRLPENGKTFALSANEKERASIARRLGVPAVEQLDGDIAIRASKTSIVATGRLRAALVRQCVASLEDMREQVEEDFEVEFLRAAAAVPPVRDAGEEELDAEAPEIHEGDVFDVGELLTQQLSLAMAPFPRKRDAVSLAEQYGQDKVISPFSVLAKES